MTIEAFEILELDVLNAGYTDLDGSLSYFQAVARGSKFRCISANLLGLDDNRPVLPPWVTLTPRVGTTRTAGPKVTVVGLTDALRYKVLNGPGGGKVHFQDPLKVAGETLARARPESDLLVVLGNIGSGPARLLAGRHAEIDVIAGCDERHPDPLQEEFNGVPIVLTGVQGKRVIRLDVFRQRGPKRWKVVPEIVTLDKKTVDDPEAVRFVDRLKSENRDRARRAAEYAAGKAGGPKYVGPEACASCHAAATAAWRASGHARAWKPVVDNGSTRVPLCFECHASGYLRPNGSSLRHLPPELAGVGCEACHGPGGEHARNPEHSHLAPCDEGKCRACHTPGQTPDFTFAGHWSRIRH